MTKWISSMLRRSTVYRAIEALRNRVLHLHVAAQKLGEDEDKKKRELREEAERDAVAEKELREVYQGKTLDESGYAKELIITRSRVLLIAAQAPCFYDYMSHEDKDIIDKIHSKLAADRTDDDARFLVNKLHEVISHPLT